MSRIKNGFCEVLLDVRVLIVAAHFQVSYQSPSSEDRKLRGTDNFAMLLTNDTAGLLSSVEGQNFLRCVSEATNVIIHTSFDIDVKKIVFDGTSVVCTSKTFNIPFLLSHLLAKVILCFSYFRMLWRHVQESSIGSKLRKKRVQQEKNFLMSLFLKALLTIGHLRKENLMSKNSQKSVVLSSIHTSVAVTRSFCWRG